MELTGSSTTDVATAGDYGLLRRSPGAVASVATLLVLNIAGAQPSSMLTGLNCLSGGTVGGSSEENPLAIAIGAQRGPGPTWVEQARVTISGFSSLADNWNGYGSAAPNQIAIATANRVLQSMARIGLRPEDVGASADEGVAFSFFSDGRFALVECFNTGEVAACIWTDDGVVGSWEVGPRQLDECVERIREHQDGNTA